MRQDPVAGVHDDMKNMAVMLIIAGAVLLMMGLVILLAGKVPWLGHLPGDIHRSGKNWSVSFPIVTCIVASIILTVVVNLVLRFMGK